ncbi:MAG: CopG family transcriptional regulator [Acidobacteriota bacterium]
MRTIITLAPEDKAWLDRVARQRHVPMTRIVAQAVKELRREWSFLDQDFDQILDETRGIWKRAGGLTYQRMRRAEWDRRQ